MAQLQDNNALLIYRVGPVLCCTPALAVETIITPPSLTHPPGTNQAHPGIFKHGSLLVNAVDARVLFGVEEKDRSSPGRMVISQSQQKYYGFWVDQIIDVIQQPTEGWGTLPAHLSGGVFTRTLTLNSKIHLYAEFEKLQGVRQYGFLRPYIEHLQQEQESNKNNTRLTEHTEANIKGATITNRDNKPMSDNGAEKNKPTPYAKNKTLATNTAATANTKTQPATVEPPPTVATNVTDVEAEENSSTEVTRKPVAAPRDLRSSTMATKDGKSTSASDANPLRKKNELTNKKRLYENNSENNKAHKPSAHTQQSNIDKDGHPAETQVSSSSSAKPINKPASDFALHATERDIKNTRKRTEQQPVMTAETKQDVQAASHIHAPAKEQSVSSITGSYSTPYQDQEQASPHAALEPQQPHYAAIFFVIMLLLITGGGSYYFWSDPKMQTTPASSMNKATTANNKAPIDSAPVNHIPDSIAISSRSTIDTPQTTTAENEENTSYRASIEKNENEVTIVISTPENENPFKLNTADTSSGSVETLNASEPIADTAKETEISTNQHQQVETVDTSIAEKTQAPSTPIMDAQATEPEADATQAIASNKAKLEPIPSISPEPRPPFISREIVHIVVKGDTLWHITERYIHNPYRYPELARLNKIKNPDLIYPGNRVRIIQVTTATEEND